ncbi:hypothetical protein D6817_02035 [Candidatus Pacearchaeota archaeon]|nr:MAG: hypothetical protein D6817_02035 [Candidatus Pacearchaeota archaeon]
MTLNYRHCVNPISRKLYNLARRIYDEARERDGEGRKRALEQVEKILARADLMEDLVLNTLPPLVREITLTNAVRENYLISLYNPSEN